MANITAAELLVGSDEDFVINLYLASLGRWPDPAGFAHMVAKVAGSEAARMQAITDLAVSPEAQARGRPVLVADPMLPAEPVLALQRQMALRTSYLLGRIDGQAGQSPGPDRIEPSVGEAAADIAELRREIRDGLADMAALRRELRERFAGQAAPVPPMAAAPDLADYVADLLAVAEARMEVRLRTLEKRLP